MRTRTDHPAFDAVIALVRDGDTEAAVQLAQQSDDAAVRIVGTASFHNVEGQCYVAAREDVRLADLCGVLVAAHRAAVFQHMKVLAELGWLGRLLDEAGIAWAVLKGPVLAEFMYPDPGMRAYNDLDVLVDRTAFGDVLELLEAEGAVLIDRNWPMINSTMRGELSAVLPLGTLLDLHWHVVVEASVRRCFTIDIDDLLANRRTLGDSTTRMPTLSASDTLWHLCLHAALAGGHELRWLDDIRRATAQQQPARSELSRRVDDFGIRLPTAVMLRKAETLLGAPAPALNTREYVFAPLDAMLDRIIGFERGARPHISTKTLTSSLRSGSASSLRALSTRVVERVRRHNGARPTPGNPLHRPVASPRDRSSFLKAIGGR
jgi:hypothetical protein